jgi:hypothetical protein
MKNHTPSLRKIVNIVGEIEVQLQACISEELGEKYGTHEEETNFPTSPIPDQNSDELEIFNPRDLPPTFGHSEEEKANNLTPS